MYFYMEREHSDQELLKSISSYLQSGRYANKVFSCLTGLLGSGPSRFSLLPLLCLLSLSLSVNLLYIQSNIVIFDGTQNAR